MLHFLREYNINKILLSHIGLWPLQSKFVRRLLPISLLILLISFFLLQITTMFDCWKDKDIIFDICLIVAAMVIFIAKLWNELFNYDTAQRLYEAMENHWNIFTSESEVRILKNNSSKSRKCIKMYAILLYTAITIFLLTPFKPILLDIISPLNESRERYFATAFEVKIDMNKYYVPLLCYNTSVILAGVAVLIGTDSIFITRIFHAYSLFYIINQHFKRILTSDISIKDSEYYGHTNVYVNNEYYMNAMLKSTREQEIYQKFVICLKKHQIALEFVDLLNSIYRLGTLITILTPCMVISLSGIQLIYVLDQIELVIKNVMIIVSVLTNLFVFCYFGQQLLNESQNVFHQAYAIEWYIFSLRIKSLLMITLQKSIIPCTLTAGKVLPLTMATYATMVRGAISYFMTFLSLKDS
ncbi:uncharacterized protein LOC105837983 isoform X2 [Monomorium pharaonis]|uniref:uncharacterized protein LOC105837983 isoform X2 n=1 Tax=Monomorium pharaonis TaxID=307658 RepID=UPI001746BEED|nr:uncharacterized protein LOC105837983 isoform X2 [Monomorium pharaonis]